MFLKETLCPKTAHFNIRYVYDPDMYLQLGILTTTKKNHNNTWPE